MTREIVVFDTETNGLNPKEDELISLGWLKAANVNGNWAILKHVERFVFDTNIHNTEICLKINKITDEFRMKNGIDIKEILREFKEDIQNCDVYAYNVNFDVDFLEKYDKSIFENVVSINEIRINEKESVINSLQRIIYGYYSSFNVKIKISKHLHSAYDDVYAEFIILLYDKFNEDVKNYFVKCDEYEPVIGTGIYKNKYISDVYKENPSWVYWFVDVKKSNFEDYLREYIKCKVISNMSH